MTPAAQAAIMGFYGKYAPLIPVERRRDMIEDLTACIGKSMESAVEGFKDLLVKDTVDQIVKSEGK